MFAAASTVSTLLSGPLTEKTSIALGTVSVLFSGPL